MNIHTPTQPSVTTIDRFSSTSNAFCETNIIWSAILIGALASVGLSFLLNLFSMVIGLTVISTNTIGNETLAIGGLIGLLIGSIACMFFSGWLAGYIARPYYKNPHSGGIYGFSAWCLALLITALTASYVGQFITNSSRFLSHPTVVSSIHLNQYASSENRMTPTTSTLSDKQETADQVKSLAGMGAFITFILFFVGALSSTIGGYCAGSSINSKCLE